MGLFDKLLNNALNWESITVSADDMAALAETQLLENCSKSELEQLQKGVKKTWVLAVGQGSSVRCYPPSKDIRIAMNFNVITHTVSQISLQDSNAKKEYFLPKGKNNIYKFQDLILRKISARL